MTTKNNKEINKTTNNDNNNDNKNNDDDDDDNNNNNNSNSNNNNNDNNNNNNSNNNNNNNIFGPNSIRLLKFRARLHWNNRYNLRLRLIKLPPLITLRSPVFTNEQSRLVITAY